MLIGIRQEILSCEREAERIHKKYIINREGTDIEYKNALDKLEERVKKLQYQINFLEVIDKRGQV